MFPLTNHNFQASGEQASVVMKFTQIICKNCSADIHILSEIGEITVLFMFQTVEITMSLSLLTHAVFSQKKTWILCTPSRLKW